MSLKPVLRGALAVLAAIVSPLTFAAIVCTGAVAPDPSCANATVNGSIFVGSGAPGTIAVDAGSTLTANTLSVATGGTGIGTVTITGTTSGAQTVVNLLGPPNGTTINNPLEVGQWGTGVMTVSNGAIVNGLNPTGGVPANCISSLCNVFIGQSAGSSGTLTLTGGGTTGSFGGGFIVGIASVSTVALNGFNLGTAGGTATGIVNVTSGATLNTYSTSLGAVVTSAASLGTEHAIAHATVDGANSVWNIAQNPISGNQAGINLATHQRATATLDITGGGQMVITGGPLGNPTILPGVNTGAGTSTINVHTGGALIIGGGTGFFNVGANGGTATLDIASGGQVYGTGASGLTFMNVGRQGANGTLHVDGTNSSITLSGVGAAGTGAGNEGNGAFLTLGRDNGSVATATVTAGASILISDGGHNTINSAAGMNIARDLGSSGTLTISGPGSSLTIEQTGVASIGSAGINVGRGGQGQLTVTGGATVLIHDNSQLAAGGNSGVVVGRFAGSSGLLTVSGVGSSLTVNQTGLGTNNPTIIVGRAGNGEMTVTDDATVAVNGSIQRNFIVGNTVNDGAGQVGGAGILTVSNGASLSASWFAVGNNNIGGTVGGTGTATIDNATVNIDGVTIAPDNSITGGGVRVGRGAGTTGTLNLQNGAQVIINTPTTTPEIYLGGTGVAPGGNGTVHMTGGSSISFTGTGATPNVIIGHSGTGLWTMDGGSTLSLPVDGKIVIGATSAGSGTMTVSGGSSIAAGLLHVGGSGAGSFTMDSGTLTILNNDVNVAAFIVGNHAGSVDTFTQTGGNVAGGRSLTLGNDFGTGTYNLSTGNNPTLTSGFISLGFQGTGTFNQQVGTTNSTGALFIGSDHGTYNQSGGALNVNGQGSIVGTFGTGVFNQSGGTHTTTLLNLGAANGASGTYSLTGGALATGDLIVGDAGTGVFNQSGGTNAISGNLVVGNQATGNGTYNLTGNGVVTVGGNMTVGAAGTGTMHMSGGATASLTSASASLVIGDTGTGLLTLDGGSSLTVAPTGNVIVGLNSSAAGTLVVTGASSLDAGSFLGIGHNGTPNGSTGASATVIVDDPGSSITATTVTIGAGGCLGGNGVIHGNLVMDGPTASLNQCPQLHGPLPLADNGLVDPTGILNPGRSPGRLVIDGGFDFISGTIVLEVESDGHGGFIVDELVFSGIAPIDLSGANIEFSFLGLTDPNAFEASGLWTLDTFFKVNPDAGGNFNPSGDVGISAIVPQGETLDDFFAHATFGATAEGFVIENFTFTPDAGVGPGFEATPIVSAVPEPAPWMLLLGAMALLYVARMRRAIAPRR